MLSFVEMFSGRAKNYLEDGLNRGRHYLPMIQEVFRAEGLPLDLAYVPLIESAFKPSAVSRAKAKGIWQFMRGTAIENGLKHDWYIDERADPEKATRAAAKYLKTLYGMFGDWHLALASYNGGPGRVQKAMRLNPYHPERFWSHLARAYFVARRYAESAEALHRIGAPDVVQQALLAAAHAQLENDETARALAEKLLEREPHFRISAHLAGQYYKRSEDREHYRAALRKAGLPD